MGCIAYLRVASNFQESGPRILGSLLVFYLFQRSCRGYCYHGDKVVAAPQAVYTGIVLEDTRGEATNRKLFVMILQDRE